MAYKFTAEDREKAKAMRDFKKALEDNPIEKLENVSQKITDLQQLRDRRKLRVLEENENLAIELENKRMRDELSGITNQPVAEKRSDLELFKQFTEIQNQLTTASEKQEEKLRERILDSITENDMEPDSTADILIKTLLPKLMDGSIPFMKKPPVEAPMPLPSNIQQDQGSLGSPEPVSKTKMDKQEILNKTDKQIIDKLPTYVKTAIKSGGLTMEAVITGLKAQGQDITDEEQKRLQKIYNKIKKQK